MAKASSEDVDDDAAALSPVIAEFAATALLSDALDDLLSDAGAVDEAGTGCICVCVCDCACDCVCDLALDR